ncbi:3-deoxy-D-manno-octulosonic acid transferase [Flavobacteriaceae bacterium R38]|nr:3-deoxy-D-manno-octulosonic acid transferase [Flavobacteriaceae bacterium R38]
MIYIYNILITIVSFFLKLASFFNKKLSLFVKGRRVVFKTLKDNIHSNDHVIWFHAASLGEFEQGLPVIEHVKVKYPEYKILVTFFSPSGYEVKKNHPVADIITYLPMDARSNVRKFLNIVNPKLAIFIKYEFWPNYLNQLKKRKINTLIISAIFKKKQAFFKPYGGFMRSSLKTFNHFFVQDDVSKELLKSINFDNVSVSGDTRFDRVNEILKNDNSLPFIKEFKQDKLCIVLGSTWKEDENLLIEFINNSKHKDVKYIIAPHNIKPTQIQQLKTSISKKTVLYSKREGKSLAEYDIFILDTIGILTKVYNYADIAYVGGGMGTTGLHNTLEPAVFGIPVIIGKNYNTFKEAVDLVSIGGIISINNQESFDLTFNHFINDSTYRKETGRIAGDYVSKNRGASEEILNHITLLLATNPS